MRQMMNQLLALQSLPLSGRAQTAVSPIEAKQLREQEPAAILAHDDELMASGGKGVAIAFNGVCGECYLTIPGGKLLDLFAGKDLPLCDNCGCYLYLPPEATAPHHAA